jgi:hypothetical protein
MSVSEAERLKQLEEENAERPEGIRKEGIRKRIIADLTLDMTALKAALSKTGEARSATSSGADFVQHFGLSQRRAC